MRNLKSLFLTISLLVLPTAANAIDKVQVVDLMDRVSKARDGVFTKKERHEGGGLNFEFTNAGVLYKFDFEPYGDVGGLRITMSPTADFGDPMAADMVTDRETDGVVDAGMDSIALRVFDSGESPEGSDWISYWQDRYDTAFISLGVYLDSAAMQ